MSKVLSDENSFENSSVNCWSLYIYIYIYISYIYIFIKIPRLWNDWCMSVYLRISVSIPDVTCRTTFIGTTYRGHVDVTVSGLPCQRWDSQSPHYHLNTNVLLYPDASLQEASNFCRNPDEEKTVWCYTTTSLRWEFCAIPMCDSKSNDKSTHTHTYINI